MPSLRVGWSAWAAYTVLDVVGSAVPLVASIALVRVGDGIADRARVDPVHG